MEQNSVFKIGIQTIKLSNDLIVGYIVMPCQINESCYCHLDNTVSYLVKWPYDFFNVAYNINKNSNLSKKELLFYLLNRKYPNTNDKIYNIFDTYEEAYKAVDLYYKELEQECTKYQKLVSREVVTKCEDWIKDRMINFEIAQNDILDIMENNNKNEIRISINKEKQNILYKKN